MSAEAASGPNCRPSERSWKRRGRRRRPFLLGSLGLFANGLSWIELWRQGDPPHCRVEQELTKFTFVRADGRQLIVNICEPGRILGLSAAIPGLLTPAP